jgi:hypothetical protein
VHGTQRWYQDVDVCNLRSRDHFDSFIQYTSIVDACTVLSGDCWTNISKDLCGVLIQTKWIIHCARGHWLQLYRLFSGITARERWDSWSKMLSSPVVLCTGEPLHKPRSRNFQRMFLEANDCWWKHTRSMLDFSSILFRGRWFGCSISWMDWERWMTERGIRELSLTLCLQCHLVALRLRALGTP